MAADRGFAGEALGHAEELFSKRRHGPPHRQGLERGVSCHPREPEKRITAKLKSLSRLGEIDFAIGTVAIHQGVGGDQGPVPHVYAMGYAGIDADKAAVSYPAAASQRHPGIDPASIAYVAVMPDVDVA